VQLTFSDGDSNVVDVSADGGRILYQSTRDDSDLWGVRIGDGKEFQLTSDIGVEFWQDVSPTGETIAYQAARRSSVGAKLFNCLLLAQIIAGEPRQIQLAPDGFALRWSPDGKQLAFLRSEEGSNRLWVVSASGGDARALTESGIFFSGFLMLPYNRLQTQDYQWSADASKLIYCARRSGVTNVWQTRADGAGETQLTGNEDKNLDLFNPLLSPDGERIVWLVLSTDNQKKPSWSVWIFEDGKTRQLYQSDVTLRLIGWSASGSELIVKSVESASDVQLLPVEVKIFGLALDGSSPRLIAKLDSTHFFNIGLSPDRKTLAFVRRQGDGGMIQTLPSTGGAAKTVTGGSDNRVYFSSLSFAPDGKTLYYGKQARRQLISIIDNFK